MQLPPVRVGDRVIVRRQKWCVADIRPGDACQLLTLSGTGPSNLGTVSCFIAPFDLIHKQDSRRRLRILGMRRWRRTCRSLLARRGTTGRLRTAATARIDLLPHQLEPALAVTRGLCSRLLIADDVGLGKTIEAALVISELKARGAAGRVLILTPAGLREQWMAELDDRFGIEALVLDMRATRRRTEQLPLGLNPWSTVPTAICSIDYVKRPEVLPAVSACRWDVVVVDEAHNVTPGSERHAAVARLCGLASYVLLLTATPHSGDRAAFTSLCDLGARGNDRLLIFRRSRRDVALGPPRRIHQLHIEPSAAECQMHAGLGRLTKAVYAERPETGGDAWLTLTMLHKRACSSAWSLEQSIIRKLEAWREKDIDLHQLSLPLEEDGGQTEQDAEPRWTAPLLEHEGRERELLQTIARLAAAARLHETKLRVLERLVRRLERRGEAVIVFTEYRDTLVHVRDALARDAAVMHGGLSRSERQAALASFTSGRRNLLLTTDAASEGLNLHHTCRTIINLELPWNPVRLEQRIGRVDRIGQPRRVHVFHLIASDTREMEILGRLRGRIAEARAGAGASDPLTSLNRDVPEDLPFFRLEEAAASEHVCLREARALLHADPAVVSSADASDGPAVAIARRCDLRLRLGSRVLALMEVIVEDAAGRAIASHVTPVVISADRVAGTSLRYHLREMVRALEQVPLEQVDPALNEWADQSVRFHTAFWVERLARSRAIADACDNLAHAPFQVGLFDRRAEIARSIDNDGRDERARAIAEAEAARECCVRASRVAVIVAPHSR